MKGNIRTIILAQILIAVSMGIIGPFYSLYLEKISENLTNVGLLIGFYWIIVGLLEIPSGILADKIGRKKVFIIGSFLFSTSIFLYPFVSNFHQLLLVILLEAVGHSMQLPSLFALLAEITKKEKRSTEMGIIDSAWNIVYGIASIIAGILTINIGFHAIFGIAGFLHLSSSLIIKNSIKENI